MRPSAEIVRVECAKCRRERDVSGPRATLCGDRACRVREMQARVRFAGCAPTLCGDRACRVHEMQARVRLVGCAGNPLRRSCVSSARNAGESAIGSERAQPSAEIVRVECAKCRRECDWACARATLCGDRACRARKMQARVRWGRCARNPLRRSCVPSARMQARVRLGLCASSHLVRFPGGVHAASRVTSSSNAHDDELGCHRLAADGGFGRPAR